MELPGFTADVTLFKSNHYYSVNNIPGTSFDLRSGTLNHNSVNPMLINTSPFEDDPFGGGGIFIIDHLRFEPVEFPPERPVPERPDPPENTRSDGPAVPPPVGIAYCEDCVKRPNLGQGYWQECAMTDGNVKFIQCEPERQIGKRIEGIN